MGLDVRLQPEDLRSAGAQQQVASLGNCQIHLAIGVEVACRGLQLPDHPQIARQLAAAEALNAQRGLGGGDVAAGRRQPVGRAEEDQHAGLALGLEVAAQREVVVAVGIEVAEREGAAELAAFGVEGILEDQVGVVGEAEGTGGRAPDQQVGVGIGRRRVGQQQVVEAVAVVVADHLRAGGQGSGRPRDGGDAVGGDGHRRGGRGDRRAGHDMDGGVAGQYQVVLAVAVPVHRQNAVDAQVVEGERAVDVRQRQLARPLGPAKDDADLVSGPVLLDEDQVALAIAIDVTHAHRRDAHQCMVDDDLGLVGGARHVGQFDRPEQHVAELVAADQEVVEAVAIEIAHGLGHAQSVVLGRTGPRRGVAHRQR